MTTPQHNDSGNPFQAPAVIRLEASGPIWRLLGVVAIFAAMFLVGAWLSELGQQWLDNVAMVITLTTLTTLRFVIRRKHDKAIKRLGPFSRIAEVVSEEMAGIQDFIDRKTLAVAVTVALAVAIVTVVLKIIVSSFLVSLSSPLLAGAVGAIVASIIILPSMWARLGRALKGS